MKKIFQILLLGFLIFNINISLISCKKESNEINKQNEQEQKGTVVFWVEEDLGNVSITVDGKSAGMISSYITSGEPLCGDAKCLTITLDGGSHNYIATCHAGTIAKNFTVISGICNVVNIDY